jgi:ubiquitin-protein ligase/DNA-directed RNA polymerase subunit RPC12/RpoP
MIRFTCPTCTKPFAVPDEYAGRRARCKACGGEIVVPDTEAALPATPEPAAPAATPKLPVRTRRLMADFEQMKAAFLHFEPIKLVKAVGDPPEQYRLVYKVQSLDRDPKGKPAPRDEHEVEIDLPPEYPKLPPRCRMRTTVFHPNIDPSTVCVGDHWTAGERLVDLCVRIGEMLAYQAYNIRSPLDAEAAMWADLNGDKLPTDPRDLRPPTA